MAPNHPPFPLYEIKYRNNSKSRAIEVIILFLLLSLISYRLFSLIKGGHGGAGAGGHHFAWLLALICETWFAFTWILVISTKWNQIQTKTYPHRLLQWLGDGTTNEFPAVDMFVTTADPELEPPILTVNTVLSLLAVNYPANKLACYVSDDGASPVTFYCLVEASKFAKIWVPFCKKYNVSVRAPFRYFNGNPTFPQHCSLEFQNDWKKMKDEYSKLCGKIEDACQESFPKDISGDFSVFSNIDRRNHPTIIKVIWENKEGIGKDENGVPHLIYISREKRPKHQHHFKAGSMNVLVRVSGVMTNAPFMLNVDCDFYANDPKVVLQAMCFLVGVKDEKDAGFAQFPQSFYGGLKDDPYGNQMKIMMEFLGRGIAGIQGPFYQGTGCFHRRKVIYGLPPNAITGKSSADKNLMETFGKSKTFTLSTTQILSGSLYPDVPIFSKSLEAAYEVATCGYEFGTAWGRNVGWMYGSATEDILTGLSIHSKGWRSAFCDPDPPGFLGCAPTGGPSTMTQQKRWISGLTEILMSKKGPIISTIFGQLQFRQCLAYLWVILWVFRPIFEISYALLPAFCIINNSNFLPKEAAIVIPASIFITYNLYTLSEYITAGESPRAWWNNQRMWRINCSASWLFGFLSVIVKVLGFSEAAFEVTKKDDSSNENDTLDKKYGDVGRFTFDHSPMFVPGTTILLVNMAALFIGFLDFKVENRGWSLGEGMCSVWVVLIYWAFLKGLFGKGKCGIPLSTVFKSAVLSLIFVHVCKSVH